MRRVKFDNFINHCGNKARRGLTRSGRSLGKKGAGSTPPTPPSKEEKLSVSTIFMHIYEIYDFVREKLNVNPENVHKIWKRCREGVSAPAAGLTVCVWKVNVTQSNGNEDI